MMLFGLHPYLFLSFLQRWISVKENCKLNSACCNKKERNILNHELQVTKLPLSEPMYLSVECCGIIFIKSPFRGTVLQKSVLFVREVNPVLQWDVFHYFNCRGRLNEITCITSETGIDQCLVNATFHVLSGFFRYFRMWEVSPSVNDYFIGRWGYEFDYRCDSYVCRGNSLLHTPYTGYISYRFHFPDLYAYAGGCVALESDFPKDAIYSDHPSFFGRKSGSGTCKTPSHTYTGEWKDDKKCGYGKVALKEGATYEGIWLNNEMCGYGSYKFKDGTVYNGMWMNARRHGHGECIYVSGSHYCGEWENDKFHGKGTLKLVRSDCLKHGVAQAIEPENHSTEPILADVYTGYWTAGMLQGEGMVQYSNGSVYTGMFKDNVPHGMHMGKIEDPSGNIKVGIWANGQQETSLRHRHSNGSKCLIS